MSSIDSRVRSECVRLSPSYRESLAIAARCVGTTRAERLCTGGIDLRAQKLAARVTKVVCDVTRIKSEEKSPSALPQGPRCTRGRTRGRTRARGPRGRTRTRDTRRWRVTATVMRRGRGRGPCAPTSVPARARETSASAALRTKVIEFSSWHARSRHLSHVDMRSEAAIPRG